MKRGYLLPDGCKDLIDVLRLKMQPEPKHHDSSQPSASLPRAALPPIVGEILVPEQTTVSQLAALLNETPFRIIADLIGLGVFVTINHQLDFDTISRVARKYGFAAKRAA